MSSRNRKAPRLAVGALLACQIGTFSTTTANAGLFRTFNKAIMGFLEMPLRVFRTNPATLLPFVPRAMDFISSVPGWLRAAYNFITNFLETEGEFSDEDTLNEEIEKIFSKIGIGSFQGACVKLMLALKNIVRSKEIRKDSSDEAEKTNFILVTGVSTPIRKDLISAVCASAYSKDALSIDLTMYDGKSTSSIIEALFSSRERRPSWMRSYSDDDDDVSPSNNNKISEYIKKNKDGVVKITATPKVLRSLDPVFTALTQSNARGKINFGGKEIYTGNLTFIIEIRENDVGDDLKFLGRSHLVSFPVELDRMEIESLVYKSFSDTFEYYAGRFGLKASFDRLSESICDVLEENPENANEETMCALCDDFRVFLDINEDKLKKQKNCDVIYAPSEGGFAIVNKVSKKQK